MDKNKKKIIQEIVDSNIKSFADGFELRYSSDVDNPEGVINRKKDNCFIAELGKEFMFYSAFVRSFDSSFGTVLENIGNSIAKLSYDVRGNIESFITPQQRQHIDHIISQYEKHQKPKISDYDSHNTLLELDTRSFQLTHATDHYFYSEEKKEHYLIELKSGGDLDNKKAKTEKMALLTEYFILKNLLSNKPDDKIRVIFATAYNKFGEGAEWKQERVRQFFADDELLIGKDYWNFVCDDEEGFGIVFEQYKRSVSYIREAIERIKNEYI